MTDWLYAFFRDWDSSNYLALAAMLSSALVSATVAKWAIQAKHIDYRNTFHQELIKRRLNAYDAMLDAAAKYVYPAPFLAGTAPISLVFLDTEELWTLHQEIVRLAFHARWLDADSREHKAFFALVAFSECAIARALEWDKMPDLARTADHVTLTHEVGPLAEEVQASLAAVYSAAATLGELRGQTGWRRKLADWLLASGG
jgi:hypothetical protein